MDFNTYISVFSAIAALLSALYASLQARQATRSADILFHEFRERHESIQAELIDGVVFEDGNRQIISIASNVINGSTAPNTIKTLELHIHQFSDDGLVSKLILLPITLEQSHNWGLKPFPSPLNIPERSAVSGWVSFHVPDHFIKKRNIDKYELIFKDSTGERALVELFLLRRI